MTKETKMILLVFIVLILALFSVFLDVKMETIEENTSNIGIVVDKSYQTGSFGPYAVSQSTKFYIHTE